MCTGMTNFNRCMATVQWGWGNGIETVRPKLVRRKSSPPRLVTRGLNDNERQVLNSVGEETVMCYKEVGEVVGESFQGTVESVEKKGVLGPVQEEVVEGEKLAISIRRKSGANMNIIQPSKANAMVVLNGPTEMVKRRSKCWKSFCHQLWRWR